MQSAIRFLLDNRLVELEVNGNGLSPTTTLLNYLRSLPNHKGVKEGCAEGDCGACTVVLAEPGKDGKLVYKAVDSCLVFLPAVHGKQVITVENLAVTREREQLLHPVQQAMLHLNGSQCGYCTPGIVMSMFALYKTHREPEKEIILDALTGNLCRCTGYRPIIEAAREACASGLRDHFSETGEEVFSMLSEIRKDVGPLSLASSGARYHKPFRLKDALDLRRDCHDALVISGATDAALRQTKKREVLPEILDLSGVDELKYFSEEGSLLVFGAGMTLEEVRLATGTRIPALHRILSRFGSLQIRNMATLGGNIGSASPIGDTLPLLFVLGASVKLQSAGSERVVSIGDFITGYRKTALEPGELITEIRIPKVDPSVILDAFKVSKRRDLDISTVSAAYCLQLEEGKVKSARMAYGGMAAVTSRAFRTENYLLGKPWDRQTIEAAMPILEEEFSPISDARSGAGYRKIAARNLFMQFFLTTQSETNS